MGLEEYKEKIKQEKQYLDNQINTQEEYDQNVMDFEQQWADRKINASDYGYNYSKEDILPSLARKKFSANEEEFRLRTQYYFKDANLMTKKAERYRRIGTPGEDAESRQETEDFAARYTNRSASKRKKYANVADTHFTKAARLINEFDEEDKSPIEIYRHRKAVMEEREKAMRNAAITKGRSKKHERYLKAKASISCITTLMDQIDFLSRGLEGREKEAFENEAAKLAARLQKYREKLLENTPSRNELWLARNKSAIGPDAIAELKRTQQEDNHVEVTDDNAALFLQIAELEKANLETNPFERIVLRDVNGAPISVGERQKEKENAAFRKNIREQNGEEKTVPANVLKDTIKRIIQFPAPDPMRFVVEGEIIDWFRSDLCGNYEMLKKTVPDMKNELEKNHVPEGTFPGLTEKIAYISSLSAYMDTYLQGKCGIGQNRLDRYIIGQPDPNVDVNLPEELVTKYRTWETAINRVRSTGEDNVERVFEGPLRQEQLNSFKLHAQIPAHDVETDRDRKMEYAHYHMANPQLTEQDYIGVKAYADAVKCMNHPALTNLTTPKDLRGIYALGMHCVKYDKNGVPLSDEEAQKHNRMVKWIETMKNGTMEAKQQMFHEECTDLYQKFRSFQFPSQPELARGWVEKLLSAETEEDKIKRDQFIELITRTEGIQQMQADRSQYQTWVTDFANKHPLFKEMTEAMHSLYSATELYLQSKGYRMTSSGNDFIGPISSEKSGQHLINYRQECSESKYGAAKLSLNRNLSEEDVARNFTLVLPSQKINTKKKAQSPNEIKTNAVKNRLAFLKEHPEIEDPMYMYLYHTTIAKRTFEGILHSDDFKPYLQKMPNFRAVADLSRGEGIGIRHVNYDKNWVPVTEEDQKNHEWNVNWVKNLSVISDNNATEPEKQKAIKRQAEQTKAVLEEHYDNLKSFKFPTAEEIKNGWLDKLSPEEMHKLTNLDRVNMSFLSSPESSALLSGQSEMIRQFKAEHPEFGEMVTMLTTLRGALAAYCGNQNFVELAGTTMDENGKIVLDNLFENHRQAGENYKREQRDIVNSMGMVLDMQEQKLRFPMYANMRTVGEAKPADEVLKKAEEKYLAFKQQYPDFSEKGFLSLYSYNLAYAQNNHPAILERTQKLKDIDNHYNGNGTITRAVGIGIRRVFYDENWVPLTEKDRENHNWNIEWLDTIITFEEAKKNNDEAAKQAAIDRMSEKGRTEINNYYNRLKKVKYPTPEEIENGWANKVTTRELMELMDLRRLNLSFESKPQDEAYFQPGIFTQFKTDHPDYEVLATGLSNLLLYYDFAMQQRDLVEPSKSKFDKNSGKLVLDSLYKTRKGFGNYPERIKNMEGGLKQQYIASYDEMKNRLNGQQQQ